MRKRPPVSVNLRSTAPVGDAPRRGGPLFPGPYTTLREIPEQPIPVNAPVVHALN